MRTITIELPRRVPFTKTMNQRLEKNVHSADNVNLGRNNVNGIWRTKRSGEAGRRAKNAFATQDLGERFSCCPNNVGRNAAASAARRGAFSGLIYRYFKEFS